MRQLVFPRKIPMLMFNNDKLSNVPAVTTLFFVYLKKGGRTRICHARWRLASNWDSVKIESGIVGSMGQPLTSFDISGRAVMRGLGVIPTISDPKPPFLVFPGKNRGIIGY